MPLSYPAGTIAEHIACRNECAVFDTSHLGTVILDGPGAFDRLQIEFTNDLRKIAPGRAQYTHLVDPSDGSVEDDIIVWWMERSRFVVIANAANTALVCNTIGGIDVTASRALIALQGPESRGLVARLSPEASKLPRNEVRLLTLDGIPCVVAGTGYTGEDGVEIDLPASKAAGLFMRIVEMGARPAGLGARDTLRMEAGLPLFGHELGPGISPLVAGLDWVVGWHKESFRGKIPLEQERLCGSSRKLWGITGCSRRPLRRGAHVYGPIGDLDTRNEGSNRETGDDLGLVTSGGYGPSIGSGIGMALLSSNAVVHPRMEVSIEYTDRAAMKARVTPLPFIHNRKANVT
ncbi:MAG: glycine cleavage system protein T [Actinobacteria bacterium]|nr:glycine cleavage system protein T [Actinomycetota bacterium]